MARTNKNFEHKKNDILIQIWEVLMQYGYEKMTLPIIIKELGISRGAFYHYFQSKEECVDEAVKLFVENAVVELKAKDNKTLCADVRLKMAVQNSINLFRQNQEQDRAINQPENAIFHQKLMIGLTKYLSPYFAEVIEQGVEENIFHTYYPLEMAEMFLTLSNFYLDIDLFHWDTKTIPIKITAYEELLNKGLGTTKHIGFFTE